MQARPLTRSDQAYGYLTEQLLAGRGGPGETISTYALAEELSMSRSPIIEALKRLEAEGLVEIVPQVGCRVVRPSAASLRELYALRGALEGLASERAAKRMTAREVRELRGVVASMTSAAHAADQARFEALDHDFHLRVIEAGGPPRLTAITRGVWSQLQVERSRRRCPVAVMVRSTGEHLGILEALTAGNGPVARERAERHVRAAGDRLADDRQASEGGRWPSSSPARS